MSAGESNYHDGPVAPGPEPSTQALRTTRDRHLAEQSESPSVGFQRGGTHPDLRKPPVHHAQTCPPDRNTQ
eukprot:1339169-Rhodomonas_salina.2